MATWTRTLRFVKDIYENDDYLWDWTDWLDGANISSTLVEATDLTVDSYSIVNSSQGVTCRLSAGTLGETSTLSCKITSDDVPARLSKRSVEFTAAAL